MGEPGENRKTELILNMATKSSPLLPPRKTAGNPSQIENLALRKNESGNHVLSWTRPMKATNQSELPEIPGIEQMSAPESGARAFAGPYYVDQIDMLVETARKIRDSNKPGVVFIAPDGVGFTIYKRTAKRRRLAASV